MNRLNKPITHYELSQINFKDSSTGEEVSRKKRIIFLINLSLLNEYTKLNKLQRENLARSYTVLKFSITNSVLSELIQSFRYFTTAVSGDSEGNEIHRKTRFRNDYFWKDYSWLKDEFSKKGWKMGVFCYYPSTKKEMWFEFYLLPQKESESIKRYDLLDI